ncbi:MAG: hypothetical protein AAGC91_14455 [Pseudomonadota bacterium]
MPEPDYSPTSTWIERIKRHPIGAGILFLFAAVTGLAAFTESLQTLTGYFSASEVQTEQAQTSQSVVATEQSRADAILSERIVGTWSNSMEFPRSQGATILDKQTTFFANGRYTLNGHYRYMGYVHPIMISGEWTITQGVLNYRVKSSNVQLVVAEGYESSTQLISIKDGLTTYVDPMDGQTKVDRRLN